MTPKQKTCFHRDWENVRNQVKPGTNSLPKKGQGSMVFPFK